MIANLYNIFTTTFYQAALAKVAELEQMVNAGLIQRITQGGIAGYCIAPAGYRMAMERWGHRYK